ncbi:MAG: phosphoribosylformylglycinamidine cyclo-ligase, partial [Rhodospirillaceae bacterium]|nr:phosphoribosylformylglycinamidine cyclo-ligase [Rhodospirillaceae bacterium]
VKSCLSAIKAGGGAVHALSHITGGGLLENIPRILPDNLSAEIDVGTWELPGVFSWLQNSGNIAPNEMARTFNCGIGMVLIVSADKADEIKSVLEKEGETVFTVGHIIKRNNGDAKGDKGTVLVGVEKAWG